MDQPAETAQVRIQAWIALVADITASGNTDIQAFCNIHNNIA